MCRKLIYLVFFVLALLSGPVFADIPVLAPGDPIVAIDADGGSASPAAEQVPEAIDRIYGGANQKYYNSGGANSGFIVTPALGPSVVRSFVIWTANDTEGRDPASWALYGTNEPIVSTDHSTGTAENWTLIASGPVSLPTGRNSSDTGPTGYSALVTFVNTTKYVSYKMVFPTVKTAGQGMQIAEIQFYGMGENAGNPSPKDGAIKQPRTVTLEWAPGEKAAQHKVWFGTDCGSMTLQATLPLGTETYTKTGLDYLTTYYWAVDEVNEPNTWQLPACWSFQTEVDVNTVIDVNLVGYWRFDGSADDSSGYENHGTMMGTAALVPGGPVIWGEVLELYDQANSLVDCGNSPFLAIPSMARNLTVSAWVKSRAGTFNEDWAPFVTKRGEDSLGWQLRKRGGQDRACFTLRGTTPGGDTNGTTPIMDNEWHCLVGTYDGTQRRLYVDGTPEVMQGETGNIADAPLDNVAIGARYRYGNATNPQGWMWGQIDEVRIYNRALSQAEVGELLERYVAYDPTPGNGAQNAAITTNLSWTAGVDVATHKVFFGTDKASLPEVAEVGTASWDPPGDLAYSTKYYWTVTEVNATGTEYATEIWSFRTVGDPALGTGQILREIWQNITTRPTGGNIALLYGWPDFPYNPTLSDMLTEFATDPSWDQYGGRIHGWLYVTVSGDYTFRITSDDNGQVWLSTDEDPANAQLIAQETGSRTLYDWPATGEEVSAPITLVGGNKYYISALWKEGTGNDHCAVSWQGPVTYNEIEVIAGCFLTPFVPLWPNRPSPADKSTERPLTQTLQWTAGIDKALGTPNTIQRVYIGADAAAVAAAGPGSPQDKGLTGGTSQFGPINMDFLERVYWKVVETDSASDSYSSPVWSFTAIHDPSQIVDPNLVGWWKLDGDADDSSGYGNHGVENGSPLYVDAYDGLGIDFDGSNDYINCGNSPLLNMSTNITVACWVKGPLGPSWSPFVTKRGEDNMGWKLRRQGATNNACFTLRDTSATNDDQPGNININDNEWHHVAGTYDGVQRNLYVDGQLDTGGSVADTGPIGPTPVDDVVIGAFSRAGRSPYIQTYTNATIDDARIYNRPLTQAEIAAVMRINLAWAWNPDPKKGATGVSLEPVLSWNPGDYAPVVNGHYVNFGADDPANMVLVSGPQTPNNYAPSALDLGTTYYWAVDEVNTTLGGVDAGRIWNFTTIDNIVVDDMETYTKWDVEDNNIFEVWVDGAGNCGSITGNNTGATLEVDMSYYLGGVKSMKYQYDNDGTVDNPCPGQPNPITRLTYSKAEALVAQLPSGIGSDWSAGGAKALSLQFFGGLMNSIDPMWVQLTDTSNKKAKVFYGAYADEDVNDMNEASWHEWLIDLADFTDINGVDVSKVKSMAIGIGNETGAAGGSGTLYFDDIRLYAPRCILARRSADFAKFDYVGDCKVDYKELAQMATQWLVGEATEAAWAPFSLWSHADIGSTATVGDFNDNGDGSYSVTGSGADIWGTADAFHYAYKPLVGDGQMTVNVVGMAGTSMNVWQKAGVMIRETLDPGSRNVMMAMSKGPGGASTFEGGDAFQYRLVTDQGSSSSHSVADNIELLMPNCVRLVRNGNNFSGFVYVSGEWVQEGPTVTIAMPETVYIGLAVTSHDNAAGIYTTATFNSVCDSSFGGLLPDLAGGDDLVNFVDYATLMDRFLDEDFFP